MVSAIVLAAGSSKRMGTANKLLLPFKGKTIIETTIQNIKGAGAAEVIVVTGHQQHEVESLVSNQDVTCIYNPDYDKGLTTSIQKGISLATGTGYMLCLSDMVLIETHEYMHIKKSFESHLTNDPAVIIVPFYNNIRGNPVVFSHFYKPAILNNEDITGCKNIIMRNADHIKPVIMNSDHVLFDIDLPEDYHKIMMREI